MKPLFSTWQWMTIIGSVVTVGAAVTAFAFNTFEAKSDFGQYFGLINQRLDRIEQKLDVALARGK